MSGTGSTDNGSFTIDGNTLETAASPDYEAKNSYDVRIQSTDNGGATVSSPFTVTVIDANDAPTVTVAPSGAACLDDTRAW